MRVLVVYHAGAMDGAKAIWERLASIEAVQLTVVVPEVLRVATVYEPSGWLRAGPRREESTFEVAPVALRDPSDYGRGFDSSQLARAVRSARPEVIHVLDEPTSGYLFQVVWERLRCAPRSRVLFYGFENLPWRLGRRAQVKWKPTWAQMAGGAAANTEALENVRRAGFPRRLPLERIFWGIPTDVFKPLDREWCRRYLSLECEHLVGFVGRLLHEKGVAVLLAALRRLPESVHAVIVGSGPLRSEIELLSGLPGLSGRIHFPGVVPQSEIPAYMNSMDVLAVPSMTASNWKEQYGRVIAEAMACGVPVVASASGAIPEVMGSAGLLVDEGDPSALARALEQVLFDNETAARLRGEGIARARAELSVDAMACGLAAFYKHVLGD